MDGGSNVVCKISHAALTEGLNFEFDESPKKSWSFEDKQQLLNKLAELLLDYRKGLCIAQHFRGILLEVLKKTQNLVERNIEEKRLAHLKFSLTLSHLLPLFPYILSFVLKYFSANGPFFHEEMPIEEYTLAIEAAYRFLTFSPATFRGLWNWGILCEGDYLRSDKTRAFFLKALSVILDCNNEENVKVFGNDCAIKAKVYDNSSRTSSQSLEESSSSINSNKNLERTRTEENKNKSTSSEHDLAVEMVKFQIDANERALETASSHKNATDDGEIVFTQNDLCEEHTIIANIVVPRISKSSLSSQELVAVPTMVKNVEALSLAFVSGKGVLISGAVGSGKTSLVEHFGSLTGRNSPQHLLKVQLGDQTDSKALIGSYCCSDVPGEFVWRAGILTRAVTEGRWLLLEDIDCAPMDVISVLIPLLESRVLSIPGRENIQAVPGFYLFATRRVWRLNRSYSESSMLDHLWSKVNIEPLTKSELEEIVVTKFPNLKPLASKLVDTFSLISSDPQLNSKPDTRTPGISLDKRLSTVRDFMKWCRRLDGLSNAGSTLLSSQDIFLEAMDCFCATISNLENRMAMALAIGAKLNLSKVKVEFVCNIYKPAVKVAPLCFTVGRITLNREQLDKEIEKPNFAFTRHSLTLLETLAVCVSQTEPVLLVGETGTGKTSAIQYLATLCNRALVVINMSQQSDSTDLIGGFKPMEMKQLVAPAREEYENLFCETFSRKQNVKFLSNVQQCFGQRRWEVLFKMMMHTHHAAVGRLSKDASCGAKNLLRLWKKIGRRIQHLRNQLKQSESGQTFSFVEGALVKALKRGDWVLLDEINLASPETLECLNGVLESQEGSVVILERGDAEPVFRHEQFRMFACMNPANDVGKKDLPAGIRNRFTEIFVSELQEISDLKTLVFSYLERLSPPAPLIDGIVRFYLAIREEASQRLTDGSGNRPYYSLRTLCRALKYASLNPCGNILRSVYEGFCISFLTQLDRTSHNVVETLLQKNLLAHVNADSFVHQILPKPDLKNEKFLNFEGYWICQGNLEPSQSSNYVFTSTVKDNLKCLARIVSGRDFPVLIQGETSVGKTSLINWLGKASGNYCVRINNHEHTDIQEYLGCYTSDNNGKLIFKEGILVDAMRKGYWIILDELNLAPTDVLEALNRLLDDNRELFIPEIQEIVKAHPKFMLFATQNPPGQYGGRKVLSRAFRNRFVELHFEELPSKELETILHKRCNLPRSYSKTLVNIMLELQIRRRGSTVFSGKRGFITLRDLFRWANRYNKSQHSDGTFFDWNQQLAEDGYFLLAGRCRNVQEAVIVQEVIQKHMKRKIDVNCLFGHPSSAKLSSFSEKLLSELIRDCPDEFGHVVFTYNMRRLAVLVARALQFNEPVLLVGETGCGKTTICQMFAAVNKKKLYAVNCHLHTESSDFLGGLRPARRDKNSNEETPVRLFEWCNGSLVLAMREGSMFLADEISLADDSVLERLNSVLEPERTLILAEKGSNSHGEFQQDLDLIVAEDGFQLLATMNPGGDYGKKELSPALRNRFTEIWCPANDSPADMIAIIEHNISPGITLKPQTDGSSGFGNAMIEFITWFKKDNFAQRCIVTVRDFLSWVKFINACSSKDTTTFLYPSQAYFHGAFLVFLDALGIVNSQGTSNARELCSQFLSRQLEEIPGVANGSNDHQDITVEAMQTEDNEMFIFDGFSIRRGPEFSLSIHSQYALNAPTTAGNAQRVMRAMQLRRPILLEGSPGVGKTSLVSALAKASGHQLVRINLSEQTDISDLFGADLPVESEHGCQFSWCDGPLLLALKSGSWIVLDELNLASQSVLEGLNACFDHRGEIFIPELGMSFQVQHERTKFFACQNPLNQGGGRKGLPKSFLNRFTQVYVEPLAYNDLLFIAKSMYPKIDGNVLEKMITFNSQVYQHCVVEGLCSKHGGSWEFNLRDIFRWCALMVKYQERDWNPAAFVQLIYVGRMRTIACRDKVWELCSSIFGENSTKDVATLVHATPSNIQIGSCLFPKCKSDMLNGSFQTDPLYILHRTLKPLESLFMCLQMNWLVLLVGPKSSGKTSLARLASQLTGTKLDVMAMNSSIDTTELLGGYEQADLTRQWTDIKEKVEKEMFRLCRSLFVSRNLDNALFDIKHVLKQWFAFCDGSAERTSSVHSVEESGPSTMVNDISQLSKLVDDAINVVRKHNFTDYKFESSKVLLKELCEHLVRNNGNSHVSGQFEWVDGQLVKALKNGHWLLIDNVNFCSPSVLDRLNGLLEPGGMLSINERGVVDGDIPVVKPHPDFRLIFAMDSKHGEISRAMRNRGVEIFMSQEDCDTDDLCSMLYASGCRHSTAIQTLSNIQNQGSLLQTIHAGSLVEELWQRGIELEKSLVMSLTHIHGQTHDFTKLAEEQPVQALSKLLKYEQKPSGMSIQKDAVHAMVNWHALPLERIIEDANRSPMDVGVAIHLFLEWCCKADWQARLHWLKSKLLSSKKETSQLTYELDLIEQLLERLFNGGILNELHDVYEKLETIFLDFKFDASHHPLNLRVNGPLYKYICEKILYDEKRMCKQLSNYTNRVYLLWTLLTLEAKIESCIKSVNKAQLRSPLWLSFSHAKGDVDPESLPHQGIVHIYPLLNLFQKTTRLCLENNYTGVINDQRTYEIWVSLKQYEQLVEVCMQSYSQDEDYHALLDLHCKFFWKGACKTVFGFLEQQDGSSTRINDEYIKLKNELDKICACNDQLAECHWKMIADFEHPNVFVFGEVCHLWARLTNLYAGLLDHNRKKTQLTDLMVDRIRAWQVALLEDLVSLIELREEKLRKEVAEEILVKVKESVQKIEQEQQNSYDVSKVSSNSQGEEHAENLSKVYSSEVIQGYCNMMANYAYTESINTLKLMSLRKKILNGTDISKPGEKWFEKLTACYNFCVKFLRGIPLNMAAVKYIFKNGQDDDGFPKCGSSVLKLTGNNVVFCDVGLTKIQERDIQSSVVFLSRYNRCSAEAFEALSVVSVTNENKAALRLVDVNKKIVECHHLTTFLWLHQYSFANLKSMKLSVDWQSLMLALIRLLHCLNSVNEIPDHHSMYANLLSWSSMTLTSDEFQQNLKNSIAGIQEIYGNVEDNVDDRGFVKYCFSEILQSLWSSPGTDTEKDNSTILESKIQHGLCWIYMGMIQSTLLRPVGNVDPVRKRNVRVDNMKHEIESLTNELRIRLHNEETLTGLTINEDSASVALQVNPSHVNNLVQYKASLECELAKLGEEVAYRPVPSQFRKITDILQDFSTYVGNYSDIIRMTQDLCSQVLKDSGGEDSKKCFAERMSTVHRLKVLVNSFRRLVLKLQDFVAYQDVLAPYISGLIQIAQGLEKILQANSNNLKWIRFKESCVIKMDVKPCLPQEIVLSILPFSSPSNSIPTTVDSLLSEETSHGLEVLCQNCQPLLADFKKGSEELKSRIWMLALNILKTSVCRAGFATPNDMQRLKTVVNCYKTLWLKKEEERKLQEEEGESLYKFKTRTYCSDEFSEEQQNQKEIDELFTRFDQEYEDIHWEKVDDASSLVKKQESGSPEVNADTILESHMAQFCKIHQLLVSLTPNVSHVLGTLNNTEWQGVENRLENVKIVSERYHIASEIISLADLCDDDMPVDTTSNHLVMSSLLLKSLTSCQGESTIKDHADVYSTSLLFGKRTEEYDIYHDSNLKEIIQVLPILTSFKCRLRQLLKEWPEHPTLVQLCQTIDRIISFPVTSPVMKILNGLEILLRHSQDWEANASRHVSIGDNLDQITEMIIRWRKLELSSWSSLLHVCETKIREKANHWWFHINDVVQQYSALKDGESPNFTELIKVFQQFMECSSIGEFSERLKILVSFSYQKTVDIVENDNSDIVRTILWNVYCYYKQFESRVVSLIEKAKASIEKELKDFIKIVKWKDINYWAMKETSTKSHYTLLKLLKKYQTALSEGIDTILKSNRDITSVEDPPHQDDLYRTFSPNEFLSPASLQNVELKNIEQESPPLMFSKMRKLTQQKLAVLRYEMLSKSVASFTDEIISTTQSLQKLEVGDKTGKARTQFSKHIHVLKKRALADLFKGLKKLGLSYRKGLRLRQQNSLKDQMMIDCSDVSKQLSNVDKLLNNNVTENLVPMIENSLKYYQKCVARFAALNNVLTAPSKELTVGDVDRMKGFAEHLRQVTQRQRENISAVGKSFSELSLMMRQLTNLATRQTCHLPPQCTVAEWTLKLDKLLNSSLETSENLLFLLDSCPDSKIDLTMSPVSGQLSDLSKCCKQDSSYVSLKNDIEKFFEEITKIKSNVYFQTLMMYPVSNGREEGNFFIATWSHFKCLESSFKQVEGTLLYLDEVLEMDSRSDRAKGSIFSSDLGFGKLALYLRQEIAKTCDEFANWKTKTFEEIQDDSVKEKNYLFRSKVMSARENILLSFQKWYKRKEGEMNQDEKPTVAEEIEDDKYFVEGLDNEMLADISILNIEERTKDIKSCIRFLKQAIDKEYSNYGSTSVQTLCEIMIGIVPCLSQYVLLIKYHFHQLLFCHRSSCKLYSVLLGIFSELLQKGFCLPPDEEEIDGEGATSFEDAENCGIGEGEGRKDVSDQIEDEGQLEGAQQQKDQEQEEGDNDQIPDEENGIEMNEDFEGETHDVEKTGESSDEDGESGDESENLEQKMGDVDGADETLDQKLWADSDTEDNEDNKDSDGNERGTGAESEDQSEMVAKEENQGSSKESKKPKMDDMEEDKINELEKNEDDMGNLDENVSDNRNEPMPDDPETEDLKLTDELELDTQENDEVGDDSGDAIDDETSEKSADDVDGDNDKGEDNNDKNSDNATDGESDYPMDENPGSVEEISTEVENKDETDSAKDEKEADNNMEEDEWKTESETKGENVESVEDEGKPDGSSGASAGKERSEPAENEESIAEEHDEGTGNSISQQSGLDSSNNSLTMHKTTDMTTTDTSFHRKQLNKSRADRILGSSEEIASKKPKVLDSEDASSGSRQQDASTAELFEHLRDENEMDDMQVYDTATEEQRKQQEVVNYPTETGDNDEAENMDEDWDLPPGNNRITDGKEEKTEHSSRFQSNKTQSGPDKETADAEVSIEDRDEADKGWLDTTSSVFMRMNPSFAHESMEMLDPEKCRSELEELLCKWRDLEEGSPEEQIAALDTWRRYELLTSAHSQQLCEQLRIVLEPSIANKLKGDYRTGKRLNMRKVIPYIASQYRKDKIWLRRTKKSKRQYQILLAIDDSSSMSDNQSKQLAFESLAVITNALTRLEAGEIAICSFGEDVHLLHPFHETFTEQSGANILRLFRFKQKQTKIAQLLDTCASVMTSARSRANTGNDVSQLLLIVSDGRGIFLEGMETVQRAVRKARESGIFLIFVILDNPRNKDSILDIKFPIFRAGQLPELKSYIEQFPFPYYIVLRDINSLSETLSDSLRQWFELVANAS